jgi:hypothetical protein
MKRALCPLFWARVRAVSSHDFISLKHIAVRPTLAKQGINSRVKSQGQRTSKRNAGTPYLYVKMDGPSSAEQPRKCHADQHTTPSARPRCCCRTVPRNALPASAAGAYACCDARLPVCQGAKGAGDRRSVSDIEPGGAGVVGLVQVVSTRHLTSPHSRGTTNTHRDTFNPPGQSPVPVPTSFLSRG